MFAYLCIATDGTVLNVTRTIAGAAHFAAEFADNGFISGDELTVEGLIEALSDKASATITYTGKEMLVVQRHALLI